MFKNLTNFSHKRNWKEAVGFYLAYLLLFIILILLLTGLAELSGLAELLGIMHGGFNQGLQFGNFTAVIFCLIVSGLLLKEKKLLKNFGYILLFLLSGILAWFGGGLLGLIIPAFITTTGVTIVENQ